MERSVGLLKFSIFSVTVGVVSGFGAVVFRALIAFFHNLFFLGTISAEYDANLHTPDSPWGALVILAPVVGALIVTALVETFAPEARGHGVPEVMDAVYYRKGVIRPVVALIKSLASALCIGCGGSVGREGPIVQIGSSFGSTMGQLFAMSPRQRIVLVAAGAGGGIAATFNTPIGGVLFAVELILHEISVKTLVPVVITTAIATYVGQLFFGVHPSFVIPALEKPYFHLANPWLLASYGGLGVFVGLASTAFIRVLYGLEDFFEERLGKNHYVRNAGGMLIFGIVIYLLKVASGHYYIEGVGYAVVQDVLTGKIPAFSFLVVLCLLKLFATSLTLASGGSGGIFSPSLFMGATAGGAYGSLLVFLIPGLGIDPAAFAVAGMAGMVGGTTGAALTAIVMIFEMTLDYSVILPMTITVALSYGVRKLLFKESIYTLKPVRRGYVVPDTLQADLLHAKRARDLMDTHIGTIGLSETGHIARYVSNSEISHLIVQEDDKIIGALPRESVENRQEETAFNLKEKILKDFVVANETDTLFNVIEKLHRNNKASLAIVVSDKKKTDSRRVAGVITRDHLTRILEEYEELFSGRDDSI
ncbi:MAG TPA: chloride channel protein [Nitrospiraceae bacterium]|nr:chloride channel protein [Nitrospiraceae bacterium]